MYALYILKPNGKAKQVGTYLTWEAAEERAWTLQEKGRKTEVRGIL